MPRIHRGSKLITRIHRGSTLITRIHRGSDLVYSPGDFMFAYSEGASNVNRLYTMCAVDPENPANGREMFDFSFARTWHIRGGIRVGSTVYFAIQDGNDVDKICSVPRNPTVTGTVTPDIIGEEPSGVDSISGLWLRGSNLAISVVDGSDFFIHQSPISSDPAVWTQFAQIDPGRKLTTGNDTSMWQVEGTTINLFDQFNPGETNTPDHTYSTNEPWGSNSARNGCVWWNDSLWLAQVTDGELFRYDHVDGGSGVFSETSMGRLGIDGTIIDADYYVLFGAE